MSKPNPYVERFLSKHPMASAAEARSGEAAWDAAIETAAKECEDHGSPHAADVVRALMSTGQRHSAPVTAKATA